MRTSKYMPSLLEQADLEAIFFQRHQTAEQLVELVSESVFSKNKHYTLLIGPWGIGKTHLVSLVYHRIVAKEELKDRLAIAWLREEEWGVSSFFDLILRILRSLSKAYSDEELDKQVVELYQGFPESAEKQAIELLKDFLTTRTLLLFMENLDEIFQGLGDEGQKKLRSFLQEVGCCTIIATSRNLFNGIKLQTAPFYGFFRIRYLKDFSVDDAVTLLQKIAGLEENRDLLKYLETTKGQSRVQAVHHLAGGNPRIYIILSECLTDESFNELTQPFIKLLDNLIPYYQWRIGWLSPQQSKIIDVLGHHRSAMPVKEIAQHCFATPQTTSSQLRELREKGYVISETHGRQSFYELREPLMRICLGVKQLQGNPIKSTVEFFRNWYDGQELNANVKDFHPFKAPAKQLTEADFDAQALTRQSIALVSDMVSQAAAEKWNEAWQNLVGDRDEFQIPLRLLKAVVEYKKSPDDPRVFLSLAIEERKILQQLLDIVKKIPT
jgi:hypothetical protein